MTELTQEPPRTETLTKTGASRAALAFIFATVLFDTLGFGIIIPVLPGLVVSFVGGDRLAERKSSVSSEQPGP